MCCRNVAEFQNTGSHRAVPVDSPKPRFSTTHRSDVVLINLKSPNWKMPALEWSGMGLSQKQQGSACLNASESPKATWLLHVAMNSKLFKTAV